MYLPSLRHSFLSALLGLGLGAAAQSDSARTIEFSGDTLQELGWKLRHKPGRAALYSAILPGAGQIYNRKYWKAPIVWGGLGVSLYFIQDNTKEYKRYRDAYVAIIDGDPNTVDEFNGEYSADALRDVADTYHKWRDLSYIALSLVYILNIVDATVDAHFVRFDVNEDLSLNVAPSPSLAMQGAAGVSLCLSIK